MAFCIHCGTDLLVDEARFCPMCGRAQPSFQDAIRDKAGLPHVEPAVPDEAADVPASPPPTDSDEPGARPSAVVAAADDAAAAGPVPAPVARATVQGEARLWRLGRGDWFAALGSVGVIVFLFLPWFNGHIDEAVGRAVGLPGNFGGFLPVALRTDAMGVGTWHWLILLLAMAIVAYVAARTLPGRGVRIPLPHWQLLAAATGINLGLVALAMALPPDAGTWNLDYGSICALAGALAAFAGAVIRRGAPEVITAPVVAERRRAISVGERRPAIAPEAAPAPAPTVVAERRVRRRREVVVVVPAEPTVEASPPTLTQAVPPPVAEREPLPAPARARETRRHSARRAVPPVADPPTMAYGYDEVPSPVDDDFTQATRVRPARAASPADGEAGRPGESDGLGVPAPAREMAPAQRSVPVEEAPPVHREVPGADPFRAAMAEAELQRAAARAQPGPDEVVCAICATPNPVVAKVCRTCGVMLGSRPGRR